MISKQPSYAKIDYKKASKNNTTSITFQTQVKQASYKNPKTINSQNFSSHIYQQQKQFQNLSIHESNLQLNKKQSKYRKALEKAKAKQIRSGDGLIIKDQDFQRFQNQTKDKLNLIHKIHFINSLSKKCKAVEFLFNNIKNENDKNANSFRSNKIQLETSNKPDNQKQKELMKLDLQVKLMKKNLSTSKENQNLSLFQIQSLASCEVQQISKLVNLQKQTNYKLQSLQQFEQQLHQMQTLLSLQSP